MPRKESCFMILIENSEETQLEGVKEFTAFARITGTVNIYTSEMNMIQDIGIDKFVLSK